MKIFCAVDDSVSSRLAIEGMIALFHQSMTDVVLCHVLGAHPGVLKNISSVSQKKLANTLTQKKETLAKTTLKNMAERFKVVLNQSSTKPFARLSTRLVKGHIADSLIGCVERVQPDLVVVGSRGLKDLPGYLLGSVSRKILLHSPCSVLVMKSPLVAPISTVLGVDRSKSAKFAAQQAKRWLAPDDVAIHVASVLPEVLTDIAPTLLSEAQMIRLITPIRKSVVETLRRYREFFLKEGFQVSHEMLQGDTRECLLKVIEHRRAQLVIVGSKGLTGVGRFTMGSVSEWIGTYAPVNVLVIRH